MGREEEWDEFYKKDISDKLPFFSKGGRIYDCLFAQQFDRSLLDHLGSVADHARRPEEEKYKTHEKEYRDYLRSLLSHLNAMLFFEQASSRTFLSTHTAANILGMRIAETRDTSTSSEAKGESKEDSVRTFATYPDLLAIRHRQKGFVEKTAWLLNRTERPIPVINCGSGQDQHPTQALTDVYTLTKELEGGIDGKRIAMVGDLKRGRTVRSLSYLMKNYGGVSLVFVSPQEFRMEPDILDFLDRHKIPYVQTDDFEGAIRGVDAVYMTRVQDEHDKVAGESRKVDCSKYHFKPRHLDIIRKGCKILHPLPRREEIDIEVDKDPHAAYWRQEKDGMWMRVALMAYMFHVDDKVVNYWSR